jgi:metal-sulfur cluster biosynthetic enzyme
MNRVKLNIIHELITGDDMATKQKNVDKQVKEVLNQAPKVEEVEVKLKYEMPEELDDVNKHKWKGMME